jgi:hypothetical protein
LQGAFTWAKSMDTSSATLAGDQFGNSIQTLDYFDQKTSRALSDFNIGRNLTINALYEVPGVKSAKGIAGFLTNGWQIGAIFQASDGIPVSPTFASSGDYLFKRNGNTTDYPDRLTGSGCDSLINPRKVSGYIKTECFTIPTAPNLAFWQANCDQVLGNSTNLQCANLRGNAGRNIIIGPGITNVNFSVYKSTNVRSISENFKIQFRAELFNALNHANFAPPPTPGNTDIFDKNGAPNGPAGVLTRTTTDPREIQFALKMMW